MLVNVGTHSVNPSYVESMSRPCKTYDEVGKMKFDIYMQSGLHIEVHNTAEQVQYYYDELMYYCNNKAARDKGDFTRKPTYKESLQEDTIEGLLSASLFNK